MIVKLSDSIVEKPVVLRDQYFDLKGLTAYSALSVSTLRGHIRARGLPAYQVDGKIIVKRSEFDCWVSKYRIHKEQDLKGIVNDVLREIGSRSRESRRVSDQNP
jgi:hypothetical protein